MMQSHSLYDQSCPVSRSQSILEHFIRGWAALADTFRVAPRNCRERADNVTMEYFSINVGATF